MASGRLRAPRDPADAGLDVLSILPSVDTALERGEAPQISPDGRSVVFVATDRAGKSGLYIRSRDASVARALPDTDGASLPFWSPDSRQLGFFAQGQLKTIAISGGSAPSRAEDSASLLLRSRMPVCRFYYAIAAAADVCRLLRVSPTHLFPLGYH